MFESLAVPFGELCRTTEGTYGKMFDMEPGQIVKVWQDGDWRSFAGHRFLVPMVDKARAPDAPEGHCVFCCTCDERNLAGYYAVPLELTFGKPPMEPTSGVDLKESELIRVEALNYSRILMSQYSALLAVKPEHESLAEAIVKISVKCAREIVEKTRATA